MSFIIGYKLLLLLVIILTLNDFNSNNFYGETSQKPRIILVGSSNLDHNFDYNLLNNQFFEYDVIGCSLSEPSGLFATIYKLEKLNPNKNDIIIFCLPHSLYELDKFLPIKNHQKTGFTKKLLFKSFQIFPIEFFHALISTNILDTYKLIHKRGFTKSTENNTISFESIPSVQLDKKYKNCYVNEKDVFFIRSISFDEDYLNKIHDYLTKEFDSEIFFRFPSIKQNEFDINMERLSFLRSRYSFINNFKASIFKNEYWYDRWYHLNSCGRDLNTKKLISEILMKQTQNN